MGKLRLPLGKALFQTQTSGHGPVAITEFLGKLPFCFEFGCLIGLLAVLGVHMSRLPVADFSREGDRRPEALAAKFRGSTHQGHLGNLLPVSAAKAKNDR